jgi:NAD-dependent DNA ligase
VNGQRLDRDLQHRLAESAGLRISNNVTQRVDLLVLADPASRSGKARMADRYGIRKIAERTFWTDLGMQVD